MSIMTFARTARTSTVLLIAALMSACASASPASAPGPSSSPIGTPAPSPTVATAADGESLVPAECSDLLGAELTGIGLDVEPASDAHLTDAMLTQAGVLYCRFTSPTSRFFGSLGVAAITGAGKDWEAHLTQMGATAAPGEGLALDYCWGEPEQANHCGARLLANQYGAELFLNNSEPGQVIEPLRRAAVELTAVLKSLPDPLARAAGAGRSSVTTGSCADLALDPAPFVDLVPELATASYVVEGDAGDAPMLIVAAATSTSRLACEWGMTIRFEILPGGAWALGPGGLLSEGDAIAVDGARAAVVWKADDDLGGAALRGATEDDLIEVWLFASGRDRSDEALTAGLAAIAAAIIEAMG